MDEVLNYIKNNTDLNSKDYIVIGLSGGPDSMALLDILIKYREEKNFNIVCAHVHHNLRIESDEEALFVNDYCKKNKIIFEMVKFEYEDKFNESLGHKMRYKFFEKIIEKYNAKYLFTAHHGDDLVETILMRIVRGSNLSGYMGFDYIIKNKNYTTIRPLVFVTKEDIIKYLSDNNIPYVIDKTNDDDSYTRNRYRKYLLPKLKEEDKNVHLKFLKFSNTIKEYYNYILSQSNEIYNKVVIDNEINIEELIKKDKLVIRDVIYKWIANIYEDDINLINKRHIDNILRILYSNKPNLDLNLPNITIVKQYNKLSISKKVNNDNYEYIINKDVLLPNGKKIVKVEKSFLTDNNVTFISSSDIKLPLRVRNIRNGDKMSIKNMDGHKKIKDIFINEKIPMHERFNYPVVTDDNGEIIWLPGIKKSAIDNKKDAKYDIILEYR